MKILRDEEQGYGCLYNSETMEVYGPIFYLNGEDPQDFFDYAELAFADMRSELPLDYMVTKWRAFEKELPGKLKEWGFIGITKVDNLIEMVWEGVECECKKADLHNATCAEDVLQHCTFLTCCGVEVEYSDYQDKRPCPDCGEGWC